ncbi:hypothetical protein GCM10012275_39490 [Longimycelium tulufanense]|uniref:Uncharacterized protein n=1 Tax=Longimycelium tulufanense TaxID=907463 RepID=A0A8J3CAD3_9PSEU|nr:hypothetical protein GCM10012275_39490 [Longimycelium tulufanense]
MVTHACARRTVWGFSVFLRSTGPEPVPARTCGRRRDRLAGPITVPSRLELWRRLQLARSVLAHRPYTPETAEVVRRVLDGEPIEALPPFGRGGAA